MFLATFFARALAVVWYLIVVAIIGYAVFYGGFAVYLVIRAHVLRRCFRCGHVVILNPRVKAVAKAYGVVFCAKCMPVGDQLAEVSRTVLKQREGAEGR
jgi:hypothetical protein